MPIRPKINPSLSNASLIRFAYFLVIERARKRREEEVEEEEMVEISPFSISNCNNNIRNNNNSNNNYLHRPDSARGGKQTAKNRFHLN